MGGKKMADIDSGDEDKTQSHEKILENFIKAGKIHSQLKKDAKQLVMPGTSALDIAQTIEKMILDAGAKPGFPCNISINDVAAHYTPELNDELLIDDNDLVKIDFGVSIEGCVSDAAFTVDLSDENPKLLDASREALDDAIKSIKPGKSNGEIGAVIEERIKSFGFRPIANLTGHMLEPYNLHAGVDIPNIKTNATYEFEQGDIFAIEPFATNGSGHVSDQPQVEIFSIAGEGKLRMRSSRELFVKIVNNYLTLPFAERWLAREAKSKLMLSASLKELINAGCLHPYPVLRESKRGLVSQFEHTVIIEHDGARVIDGENP
jgi:methionyl aminopeptidase